MNILTICIFISSLLPSFSISHTAPSAPNSRVISQTFSIHHLTSSLEFQLDGEIEIVPWESETILLETTVEDITPNAPLYSLDYVIQKGHFKVLDELIGDGKTLLLKSKKINNTIYQGGHKQKTKQTFKIFIPIRLQDSVS